MVCIYVLKLEENKYYVGKTNNPEFRLRDHFNQNGSEWTKKYKPLKIIELKTNCDNYDEDKITKQYMDKYGINNVRGGSFVTIILDKPTINILKQMSNGVNDRCFICGEKGHFANDCDMDKDEEDEEDEEYEEYEEVWGCEYCGKEFTTEKGALFHENIYCKKKAHFHFDVHDDSDDDNDCCYRCGREGHYASSCYASKHINGYYLN